MKALPSSGWLRECSLLPEVRLSGGGVLRQELPKQEVVLLRRWQIDWKRAVGGQPQRLLHGERGTTRGRPLRGPTLLRVAPVGMTEVLAWGDPVADELLEFLQLGEATALLARPQ